jgi:hypothetical protein
MLKVRKVLPLDVDRDGDPDIVASSMLASKFSWFENLDGRGTFGPAHDIVPEYVRFGDEMSVSRSPGFGGQAVEIGDIDGDGLSDVVVAYPEAVDIRKGGYSILTYYQHFEWYKNLGNGEFGKRTIESYSSPQGDVARLATQFELVDIDGDRDLDVIADSYHGNDVMWYENVDGAGTYGPRQTVDVGLTRALDISYGDLDGDHDMDIIVVASELGLITWYENTNGRGSFSQRQVLSKDALGARWVQVVDIDKDGDADILTSHFLRLGPGKFSTGIRWMEQTSSHEFNPLIPIVKTRLATDDVYTSDLDNDGDLDIFLAGDSLGDFTYVLYQRTVGDVNEDGRFDSSDLVAVFQSGKYEDEIVQNSTYNDGDWDGDFDFTSSDLVLAMQSGIYEGALAATPSADARRRDSIFAAIGRVQRQDTGDWHLVAKMFRKSGRKF